MTEIVAVRVGQRSPRSSRVSKEGDDEMKANDERQQRRGQVEGEMQQIARVLILMLPIAEGEQDEKDPSGNDMAHRVEEET